MTLIYSFISLGKVYGQIIDNEQAPASIHWHQIQHKNFQLIFPESLDSAALKLASTLPRLYDFSRTNLKVNPPKIPIILQGNHIAQNGFVQLAPRKSELFPTPSAIADNQQWLPNLALHELRHVAQFDKLTGKFKSPFWEQLGFALYGLNLPAWYFEGDAVQTETLYSAGGRGRLPSWEMPIRANLLSGKSYGFSKYVLGSFKDNIPSHYTIGFFLNSYLTNHYGLGIHEKIMQKMQGKLLRPFNFRRAVREASGEKPAEIFAHTFAELQQKWTSERPIAGDFPNIKTAESRFPSDYLLPQMGENGDIFALKSSPTAVNEIVSIDTAGNEKKIIKPGLQLNPYFDIRGHEIAWDAYRKHPRYGKQTYNLIQIYDLNNQKVRSISHKSRYYTPAFHPHRDELVVVEVSPKNESRLLFLDTKTGAKLDSITAIPGIHLQHPRYQDSGKKILAIAVSEQGTNLIEFNRNDRTHHFLLAWGNQQLERPLYQGENIVYKAHNDGIDNIYLLERASGQSFRLTDVAYGAFHPSIDNKGNLLYNDYQYNGYKLAKKPLKYGEIDEVSTKRLPYLTPSFKQLSLADTAKNEQPDSLDQLSLTAYNPGKHLFNFHSLSISSSDFESFDNYIPGLFWLSNDLLNSTSVKLGYEFDPDIAKSRYSAEFAYKRYLPVFTARYVNRGMVGNAVSNNAPDEVLTFDYREHYATFDMSIPLSIYRRNWVYSYGFVFGTSYSKRYQTSLALQHFQDVIAFPLNYQLYFNRNSLQSKMDLAPRWGQNVSFTFRHLPFQQGLTGKIWSLRSNFYFPGLLYNHSLQVRFAAQQSEGAYLGSYDIPMVSGWGHFNAPIIKNTAQINYRFPLAYPDWSLASTLYIKRLQALLFSDFQNIDQHKAPKSFGIGFSADLNVFRYVLPDINVSTKLIYLNDRSARSKVFPTFGLSYSY